MKRVISILILFLGIPIFSQQTETQKNLLQRITENIELLISDPKKAFEEAKTLEIEARHLAEFEIELMTIDIQCTYHKVNNDFEQMLKLARTLLAKSKQHKLIRFEVVAGKHIFEALIYSGLDEEGYSELKKATLLAESLNEHEESNLLAISDIYIANANYYLTQKDYINQLKYIELAGDYFKKISNQELREKLIYIYNSNLASAYIYLDKYDSVVYYAELSLKQEKKYDRVDIQFNNYTVLGTVAFEKGNYDDALINFHKAENLKGYKHHLNLEFLYKKIIEIYHKKKDVENSEMYQSKLDSLQLSISRNQNKSLHSLIKERIDTKNENLTIIYIVVLIALIFISFLIWYLIKLRITTKDNLTKEAKLSEDEFSKLIELLKTNDPTFMFYFNQKFENFTQKIQEINPSISTSELEICALMKLQIPTKSIAKYKYLAPKTVQNKKHIIRKKMNLSSDVNLYNWFYEI